MQSEAKFHSVTNMNCKHEGEALGLDEPRGSKPSSNSLMVIKVIQQSNGALIPTFIYTTEAAGQFA